MEAELKDVSLNQPLNVTGYAATAQLRKSYQSNTKVDFVTSLSTGLVILSMNANTTALIEAGRYVYDVKLTGANNVVRVIEGLATVTPASTRS